MDESVLIDESELKLQFTHPPGRRVLSFKNCARPFTQWRAECRQKLTELIGYRPPGPGAVRELRRAAHEGVEVRVLVMGVSEKLSVPAYLLTPGVDRHVGSAVMAIHGHSVGRGEGCLGLVESGYHGFAMELARAGHLVLLPIHRGFGPLRDLAGGLADYRLDYEQAMHFSYVTDAFVRGRTVVAQNVEDLLRWEHWLAETLSVGRVHAAGLSYGGDLALGYPVFSDRVERIFASGSCASFEDHFCRCYNGPAHCIPGITNWMERSDVAGLNAPRPTVAHFGELDTPCLNEPGRDNYAAAYNEDVPAFVTEARQIYAAAGAEEQVELFVTRGTGHAMDVTALLSFFRRGAASGG